jgi:hypothetical protein
MKKSIKIILLFFTILLPVIYLLLITGWYYQIFYGNYHQSFITPDQIINGLKVYGLKYVSEAVNASDKFMNSSWLIFVIYHGVILFFYAMDLMHSDLKKDSKVSWFSIFIWSFGMGMIIYFYFRIWKENSDMINIPNLQKKALFLSEEY